MVWVPSPLSTTVEPLGTVASLVPSPSKSTVNSPLPAAVTIALLLVGKVTLSPLGSVMVWVPSPLSTTVEPLGTVTSLVPSLSKSTSSVPVAP